MTDNPDQGSRYAVAGATLWKMAGGLAALVAAVVAFAWWYQQDPNPGTAMTAVLLIVVGAVGYLVPTIIAMGRKHRNAGAIIAVNLLLGWTLIGWLIAFIWSLTSPQPPVVVQQYVAPTQYQVGDVVNGHRFNGQTWEPLQ